MTTLPAINDLLHGATHVPLTFGSCASLIVTLCATTVLTAVLANFIIAKAAHTVHSRRTSFVATGSMLAFFGIIYCLVRFRIGASVIPQIYYPAASFGLVLVFLGTVINLIGRFNLAACRT